MCRLLGIVASEPTEFRIVLREAPHRHKEHGRVFRVRIDVTVPGDEIVVGRTHDDKLDFQDAYAAIDAAFDEARRQVQDHAKRRRDLRRSA